MPRYDESTEVTMTGTVEKIVSHMGKMGWNGTHVRVKFEAETLMVHVGPTPHFSQEGFTFAEGDQIEVIGSKLKFEGKDILVARERR